MRDDLKSIPGPRRPMLTKPEIKKIAVEFAGVLLLFALGIASFFLLAMMYETPAPSSLYSSQTRGEVMSK